MKWFRLLVEIDVRSQSWVETLNDSKTINAINIDAEYEALCAEYALVTA